VYQQAWQQALDDLDESFFDLNKDLNLGVFHMFGTGSGDQLNPMLFRKIKVAKCGWRIPRLQPILSKVMTALVKHTHGNATASQNGLSSNRDVWVYTSGTAPIGHHPERRTDPDLRRSKIQLDNLDEGVKCVDVIRNAHGLADYSGIKTKAALIDEMLVQRRYSLFYEGHRWIDLRRYNRLNELSLDRVGDDVWTKFPLPVTEL
jgi:hypothetical protein